MIIDSPLTLFSLFAGGGLILDIGLSAGYENVQELLGQLGGEEDEDDEEEEEGEGEDEESSAGAVSVEGSIDDEDDDSVDGGRKQMGDKSRGQVVLPTNLTYHTLDPISIPSRPQPTLSTHYFYPSPSSQPFTSTPSHNSLFPTLSQPASRASWLSRLGGLLEVALSTHREE